jgi:hypothetical protein
MPKITNLIKKIIPQNTNNQNNSNNRTQNQQNEDAQLLPEQKDPNQISQSQKQQDLNNLLMGEQNAQSYKQVKRTKTISESDKNNSLLSNPNFNPFRDTPNSQ